MSWTKFKRWWRNDALKRRRLLRGFIGWLGGAAMQMAIVGPDVMMTWTTKRWAIGFAVAAIPGLMGLINLGDKNPPTQPPAPSPATGGTP